MGQTKPALEGYSLRKYPTIGVCGLDCGLCPRYYTRGPSRCPGCGGPDFSSLHPSCAFITCCVKKRNLEVCAECSDFPCSRFKTEEEYQQLKESTSYPSYKVVMRNLTLIQEQGIETFMDQQKKRIEILEEMIDSFDEGRSRSFFCRAACVNDLTRLESALNEALHAVEARPIKQEDKKARATILRDILNQATTGKSPG